MQSWGQGEKVLQDDRVPTRNIGIEKVSSKYKNDVLDITVPKKEKSSSKNRLTKWIARD